jgi:hypothetical protein
MHISLPTKIKLEMHTILAHNHQGKEEMQGIKDKIIEYFDSKIFNSINWIANVKN